MILFLHGYALRQLREQVPEGRRLGGSPGRTTERGVLSGKADATMRGPQLKEKLH